MSTGSIAVHEDYSVGTINIEEGIMSAADELAAIQARLMADENEYDGSMVDQSVRDRRYLLSQVRQQQARLDKVEAVASDFAERGERIEEQFGQNGDGSIHANRAAGLGDGYREAARSIRAALGPAMSEPGGEATATAFTRRPLEHRPQPGATGLPPEDLAG